MQKSNIICALSLYFCECSTCPHGPLLPLLWFELNWTAHWVALYRSQGVLVYSVD